MASDDDFSMYGDEEYMDNSYDPDEGIDDPADDDDDRKSGRQPQQSYRVLDEEDIRKRQEEDLTEVCAVLPVTRDEAKVLLLHCNWCVSKVHDEWFAKEENEVRKSVGLFEKVASFQNNNSLTSSKKKKQTCSICFESYGAKEFDSLVCGHSFCKPCWSNYIRISIDDGPGCLTIRCPETEPSCRVIVDQDMVNRSVSDAYKDKYAWYFLRSYVESSKKIKWCPSPGCEFAVEFEASGDGSFDVICNCSHGFCWNCKEEAHRPLSCDTVSKWILKNSKDAENTNWILTNSKPCPKCRKPIEKNKGCMHMTCWQPCRHEFCWICLGDWKTHSSSYSCNRYDSTKAGEASKNEQQKREMAESYLERYVHYYERWTGNHSSKQKAVEDLKRVQAEDLNVLSDKYSMTLTELSFIPQAWLQIIECRQVLKWTYAYGYYISPDEPGKKSLFEYLQGQAESSLERLHHWVEEELKPFLIVAKEHSEFAEFCARLQDLNRITRTYFENLVRALENDLADVESHVCGLASHKNN